MNIDNLDLNLLLAFEALFIERNVTRAGRRLNLSQPSMSNALVRLRERCKDPLFVRVQGGMEPTPFAMQIADSLLRGLAMIRSGFESAGSFDAASTERTFRLVMSDFSEFIVVPRLADRFKQFAPRARLLVLPMQRSSYRDALQNGEADLAIGHLPELQSGFFQQGLFNDEFVCVFGRHFEGSRDRMSMDEYLRCRHLIVNNCMTELTLDRVLHTRGFTRHVALSVPHYMVVGRILETSDLVFTSPRAFARELQSNGELTCLPLPFSTPRPHVRQFWHERFHHDSANRWLREQVLALHLAEAVGVNAEPDPMPAPAAADDVVNFARDWLEAAAT